MTRPRASAEHSAEALLTTAQDHLAAIARAPRPAGSESERAAQDYCESELCAQGFDVQRVPFDYSALPGRYGTPIAGVIGLVTVCQAAALGLRGVPAQLTASVAVTGIVLLAMHARAMLGDAVLDLPQMRARGVNLVATRGTGAPRVWLMAHIDSKSQPIPSAARVIGVAVLALSLVATLVACGLQLAGVDGRTPWWVALALAVVGGPLVTASVVGSRSDGAVDNASGVASVLLAARLMARDVPCGVCLTSAEELGLAGARAFARETMPAIALNCDGVDDDGEMIIMHRGGGGVDDAMMQVLESATDSRPVLRRMPLGLLTDSVALTDRGWRAVTVSHGSLRTLRRVHTEDDTLDNLRGEAVPRVALLLARAAELLAS